MKISTQKEKLSLTQGSRQFENALNNRQMQINKLLETVILIAICRLDWQQMEIINIVSEDFFIYVCRLY